jgi:hypothetical protein
MLLLPYELVDICNAIVTLKNKLISAVLFLPDELIDICFAIVALQIV